MLDFRVPPLITEGYLQMVAVIWQNHDKAAEIFRIFVYFLTSPYERLHMAHYQARQLTWFIL